MLRQLFASAFLATLAALWCATQAWAQDGGSSRSLSLGERLQNLRRSLLPSGEPPSAATPHAARSAAPSSGSMHRSTTRRGVAGRGSTVSGKSAGGAHRHNGSTHHRGSKQHTAAAPRSSRRTAQPGYRPSSVAGNAPAASAGSASASKTPQRTTRGGSVRTADSRNRYGRDATMHGRGVPQKSATSARSIEPRAARSSSRGLAGSASVPAQEQRSREIAPRAVPSPPGRTLPPRRASSVGAEVSRSHSSAAHRLAGRETGSSEGGRREYVLGDRATPEQTDAELEKPARLSHADTQSVQAEEPADSTGALLVQRSPSLLIETVGPSKIKVGKKSAYRVSVTNEGRSPAHDVVLTVEIPEWVQVAGAKPSSGAIDTVEAAAGAIEVRWEIPRLEAGATEGMVMVVVARESRPLDLAVRWSHAPGTTETTIEVQEPKLELSLTGPKEVYYGEKAQYRLTIANPGNGDAEDVVVRLLPTTAGEAQSEGHPLGTIAAGTSKTVELELIARQAGLVVIRAEATAEGDLRATGGQEVLVRRADVAVSVGGPEFLYAGTTATFEIEVTNPGNATAKNIEIAAILPSGAEYVASDGGGRLSANKDQVLWHLTSLQPGSRHIVLLKCMLGRSGQNRMQVTVNAEGDLQTAGMTVTQVEAVADLKLEVFDPQVPVRVGDRAVYEVRIRNRGSKAAENVDVVAFFSEGVEPAKVEGLAHRIAPGEVTFDTIRSIGPGEEVVLKIEAVADRPGAHIFRAEVRCKALEASLAAEETTRFYQSTRTARRTTGRTSTEAPRALGNTEARQLNPEGTRR